MQPMDPREVMQATAGKLGDIGAAFYFAPETLQQGKEVGLDGFRFYFLGRGGVLGDVEAGVIRAAFGYFEPGLVEKIWSKAPFRPSKAPSGSVGSSVSGTPAANNRSPARTMARTRSGIIFCHFGGYWRE